MTTTSTETSNGPLYANGTATIPFDFQAISEAEVEVTRNGVVADPLSYTVGLSPDGTGWIAPGSSWGTDEVFIYSKPDFLQQTSFSQHGAFYPNRINPALDRIARGLLALRNILLSSSMFNPAVRAEGIVGWDADGNPMIYVADDFRGEPGPDTAEVLGDLATAAGSGMVGFQQPDANATLRTQEDKGTESLSVADFAGISDTLKVNNAIAAAAARGARTSFYLDRDYLVTVLTNPYGIQLYGPGRVLMAITGGNQQLNSYADGPGDNVIGREYLYRVFVRAMLGQSGSTGNLGIFLFGDSTVASPGYLADTPQVLLRKLMEVRGVGNVTITNRGVAGTKISDMNAIPDLGPTTDLAIIKYGINDGTEPEATRLATFASALDSKLTAMRADPDGSVGSLAIILVGPNTTADTPNGRDERWYEQLRGIYVAAARKHQCCYIDTYAEFRDARGGANAWLDALGVHPAESLGSQIWALIADTIITRDEAVRLGTSNFRNLASNVYAPTNAALPSQWPMGLTVARAQSGLGFPIDGFIISMRSPEFGTLQWLYPYAANNSRAIVRTCNVGADTFNRWTGVAEAMALSNGWANFGSGFANAGAIMLNDGMVHLQGTIAGGTTTANTLIATLPAGMAPASSMLFECVGNSSRVVVKVLANGEIRLQTTGDAVFTSFDNISFLAA